VAETAAERLGHDPSDLRTWDLGRCRALWRDLAELGWDQASGDRAAVREIFRLAGERLVPLPLLDTVIAVPLLRARTGRPIAGGIAVVAGEPWAVDGTGPTLTATVDLVPFAAEAAAFVVPVNGPDGPAVAVVDASRATVEPGSSFDVCSRPGRVVLDGVAAERVLSGAEAESWWADVVALSRLAVAAETSGVVAAACEQAVEYVRERRQFGRPVGSFQAVQHLLAAAWARSYTLDALCEDAATCPDGDAAARADAAKAYAARVGLRIVEDALQAHGAIGYTQERPLHLFLKRAMTLAGRFGEGRELERAIGRRRLAEARDGG
jgi:alkylation response protein AidB-like acyl-CoA dehydrogenase